MNRPYNPPHLEQWVTDTFINAGILSPFDLQAGKICDAFNIEFGAHFGIAGSKRVGLYSLIVIDKRLDLSKQREQFFHELGHLLWHEGDQVGMLKLFREKQEWDANLFSMYASIPFHMINFERGYTLHSIMEEFQVSKELAMKRIDDIRQKTFWEHKRRRENPKPILHPFNLKNCTDETKRIMTQLSKQTGVRFL